MQAVLKDVESSPLPENEKTLFRFIEKVNHASPSIGPDDIAALHGHGWSDEAIYDAITVCAMFNFFNQSSRTKVLIRFITTSLASRAQSEP